MPEPTPPGDLWQGGAPGAAGSEAEEVLEDPLAVLRQNRLLVELRTVDQAAKAEAQ